MAASSASPRISDAREPNGYDCPYPRASPASPRDSDRRHTNWKRLPGSAGRAAACISLPQPEDSVVNAIDSMARKGMRSWRRHRSWRHQGKGRNRLPARRIGDLVEPSNRRTVEPSNRRAVEPRLAQETSHATSWGLCLHHAFGERVDVAHPLTTSPHRPIRPNAHFRLVFGAHGSIQMPVGHPNTPWTGRLPRPSALQHHCKPVRSRTAIGERSWRWFAVVIATSADHIAHARTTRPSNEPGLQINRGRKFLPEKLPRRRNRLTLIGTGVVRQIHARIDYPVVEARDDPDRRLAAEGAGEPSSSRTAGKTREYRARALTSIRFMKKFTQSAPLQPHQYACIGDRSCIVRDYCIP